MNKHGATLVELLAAVGALAAMALTIAAMSGMVATSNASIDKNALALSQANVALETVIDGVKNSPVMPGSVPQTVATIDTCTNYPSPGGGCQKQPNVMNCAGWLHEYCHDGLYDETTYTRSLCFKVASGGSAVQYMSPDNKTMQSVFLKGNTVVHVPDMSKYNAANSSTYQVLASNVSSLAFSSGSDARLTMRLSVGNTSTASSSLASAASSSGKALSGSSGGTGNDYNVPGGGGTTGQDTIQTSVLPDKANGLSAAKALVN